MPSYEQPTNKMPTCPDNTVAKVKELYPGAKRLNTVQIRANILTGFYGHLSVTPTIGGMLHHCLNTSKGKVVWHVSKADCEERCHD